MVNNTGSMLSNMLNQTWRRWTGGASDLRDEQLEATPGPVPESLEMESLDGICQQEEEMNNSHEISVEDYNTGKIHCS